MQNGIQPDSCKQTLKHIYIDIYEGYSKYKVKFAKGVDNRKYSLLLHFVTEDYQHDLI